MYQKEQVDKMIQRGAKMTFLTKVFSVRVTALRLREGKCNFLVNFANDTTLKKAEGFLEFERNIFMVTEQTNFI